ncbi:hypothetical protein [Xenorhabdus bovienii]|nr:hypothetical protein [Xenorhabdus bovienii]
MKTFSDSPIAATGWLCGTAITINLSVLLFLGLNTRSPCPESCGLSLIS